MIQVESRKTFRHGFVLTEAELRRIVDNVSEQFQKLGQNPNITYTLTYRNGVVADTALLEDVLSQENSGSGQIVKLRVACESGAPPNTTVVVLEFINADAEDEPGYISMRFLIRGQSRDWVFVTSTMIEERITKIRRDGGIYFTQVPLQVVVSQ
jgi:hypothetical protein